MGARLLVGFLALLLLSSGPAWSLQGQRAEGEPESRQLGENFAVTLMFESAGVKENFTILTAMENFLVETQVGRSEERIDLQFEGRILFKEHQLIIGDRRMESAKPILVRYRIQMHGPDRTDAGPFTFGLQGSAFLEENREVVIARTTQMTLQLRISRD